MSKRGARIADFMAKLSVDPKLRRRFQEDPAAVGGEVGLADEDLELLSGGSADQIQQELGGDATANCFTMFVADDETSSLGV
jgi:hypothetical protein